MANFPRHVSTVGKEELQRRARSKIAILLRWATSSRGIPWRREGHAYVLDLKGSRRLEYFPSDVGPFADWNSEMAYSADVREELFHLESFSGTSFRKPYHDDVRRDAIHAMKMVNARASKQLDELSRPNRDSTHKNEIQRLINLVAVQERDINALTDSCEELTTSVAKLNRVIENNDKITLYEVRRLEEQVAKLTQALHNAQSLRLVKKDEK